MIKLSILIPTVHTRWNTFLPKIQEQIYNQYYKLSVFDRQKVEILILSDTKTTMLGEKRNAMVDMCKGDYFVFIDDDDRISDDYIEQILKATESNCDIISFNAEVSLNGEAPKICYYSKNNKIDYNTKDAYFRIPNHICCVKKSIGLKSSFPNIKYGEDSAYSKLLLPSLYSEHKIDKVLYFYDYNQETTETQEHLNLSIRMRKTEAICDVIILSNAKDGRFSLMTQKTIDTCIAGANSLPINVIVIEQNERVKYKNAVTVNLKESFNYNKFCNLGAEIGKSEWVMFANNDLIFTNGWLHNLLIANHDVVSPKCDKDFRQKDILENEIGEENGKHFSGWCFMMKRKIWEQIGKFDDCVNFWFSDDVVIEQIKSINILPMIVANSIVNHLGSTTLKTTMTNQRENMTWGQCYIFNKKYGKTKFEDHPNYIAWKKKNNLV